MYLCCYVMLHGAMNPRANCSRADTVHLAIVAAELQLFPQAEKICVLLPKTTWVSLEAILICIRGHGTAPSPSNDANVSK